MDTVVLIKFVSLLLYPLGLVLLLAVLGLLSFLVGRARLARGAWFMGFLVLWLFATPQFAIYLASSLEGQFPPKPVTSITPHDAIAVMGGGLRLPSEPVNRVQFTNATDRYWLAAQLYAAGKAPLVVLLGGNVFTQPGIAAESEYARALLVEWGVPDSAIVIDSRSRTSEQNAEQLQVLLNSETKLASALNNERPDVLLVTSALHLPRSDYLVRRALSASTIVTPVAADILIRAERMPSFKYWLPDAGALHLSTLAMHEIYGLWFVKLQDRAAEWF